MGSIKTRRIVLSFIVWCCLTTVAAGQDYRSEIMKSVVDPCYLSMIENGDLGKLGTDKYEMLALFKIMQEAEVEKLMGILIPVVKGKRTKDRKVIYAFGLSQCLRGVAQGR